MRNWDLTTEMLSPAKNFTSSLELLGVYVFSTNTRQSQTAYSIVKFNKIDVHFHQYYFLIHVFSNVRSETCLYRT